jgi:hypothetical protein
MIDELKKELNEKHEQYLKDREAHMARLKKELLSIPMSDVAEILTFVLTVGDTDKTIRKIDALLGDIENGLFPKSENK